jgi:rare lipoprotein A
VDALSAIDIQSRRSGNEVIRRRLVVHDLVRPFEIDMIRQVVVVALLCAASSYALAEQGRASHYGHGDGFHGRKTASGERFNALAMTAAHRTRPMGSHVTATNLANGRSVQVRVNDRGPSRRTGKITDLSFGASRVIGMGGTARVSVQYGGSNG